MKFILGKKLGMTQVFTEDGKLTPVTLVEAGPCKVLQLKNDAKDGYEAIQIGFEEITKKNQIKKSAKDKHYKHIREFPAGEGKEYSKGEVIDVTSFEEGDEIKVVGISKGKGFQGGVKRHGFAGAGSSHGIKHSKRKIGSIGSAFPQRVIKGRKMPGRMGSDRINVKGLKIIKIDSERNIIAIKGALPGRPGTLLEISVQ